MKNLRGAAARLVTLVTTSTYEGHISLTTPLKSCGSAVIIDSMNEDLYFEDDRFERLDDYNVWEERELMADYQSECYHEATGFEEEFDDYFGAAEADAEAEWRYEG